MAYLERRLYPLPTHTALIAGECARIRPATVRAVISVTKSDGEDGDGNGFFLTK